MADNTTIGTSGDVIRTDDIAGVKFPVSKIALGADGVDGGLVSSSTPLPVSAASLPLPTGAATETTLAAAAAKLPSALVSGRLDVNIGASSATVPVSGTFYQATQPVSIASAVAVTGTFWQATQPVSVSSLPLPSGAAQDSTLTGGTQKAIVRGGAKGVTTAADVTSTSIDTDHNALDVSVKGTVAVSGTFWQATQPVSGTVTANAGTGTMATSSTQLPSALTGSGNLKVSIAESTATTTVSGTVTANIGTSGSLALDATLTGGTQQTKITDGTNVATVKAASTAAVATDKALVVAVSPNNTVAVTGTFWQATQPVSGTVTANIGTSGSLALDATLTGGTLKAIARGGAKGTTTAADVTSTAEGSNNNALDVQLYHGGSAINPQTIRALTASDVVTIAPPTLTKGTQGSTGISTQDLKDAGRVYCCFTASAVATVTSEALITLTPYRDLTAGSTGTTFAVTASKKLRLQQLIVTARATSTVNVGGVVRLRMLAGTVLVGSPVHASIGVMSSNLATAVAGNAQTFAIDLPEGLELSGTMQVGMTQLFSATTATIDVHLIGYEY